MLVMYITKLINLLFMSGQTPCDKITQTESLNLNGRKTGSHLVTVSFTKVVYILIQTQVTRLLEVRSKLLGDKCLPTLMVQN